MTKQFVPQPTYQATVQLLAQELVTRLAQLPGSRFLLGITGGPAAGKSTFADSLRRELETLLAPETVIVVPMDGFHKTNRELHDLSLWERKGDAETFDAAGFVDLITRIRHDSDKVITAPRFDRETDEPVAEAIVIQPEHRFIIVEGNYLLLPSEPWREIPGLLDDVWYLEAPDDVVYRRLKERHLHRGLSGDALDQKIWSSDLQNVQRVAQSKHLASRVITLPLQDT